MHGNEELLTRLFRSVNAHDHENIAACYHRDATFLDIAFRLNGKEQIHAMWKMICLPDANGQKSDIVATVQALSANDHTGRAVLVDDYTIRDSGRKVHNEITSSFTFQDGLILKQVDECDPVSWATQAIGGLGGIVVGRVGFIRRAMAMKKLKGAYPHSF